MPVQGYEMTIFCPKCDELILDEPGCPACGWRRPAADQGVGQAVWTADLDARLIKPQCYPVIAGGRYWLGTEEGVLLALDLDSGKVVYERTLGEGCLAHGLATDGTRVFIGCEEVKLLPTRDRALLALDAASGDESWTYPTGAHSLSAVTESDGAAYFSDSDGRLHAVDARSGQRRWAVQHLAWASAAPAVGEGIVCTGGQGEMLAAYSTATGERLWHVAADGWFNDRPSIANGAVYARCWDGTLYALEVTTGRTVWRAQGERGHGHTSAPVAAGGRVFIGSRVHREEGWQRIPGYALLALDAGDGTERWRFHTARHIRVAPAVTGGLLLFGSNDRAFYALEAATGAILWQVELESRIVTQPQVAGELVICGDRDGTVYALRWRAEPQGEPLAAAEYESQGHFAEAAVAHALQGNLERAAAIYEQELDQQRGAAQLYERAGQAAKAAALWEGMGDLQRARDLFESVGSRGELARVLDGMGEPLEAARLREEMGDLERAAHLYERAGDRVKAADLYRQMQRFDEAERLSASLGQWELQVNDLIAGGKLAKAARILEAHERWERAAGLYEELDSPGDALRLRRRLGHWEQVAELALRLGDEERRAEALEKLGRPRLAAEAYEGAAQKALALEQLDEPHAADLYAKAARLYDELFEEGRAAGCQREVQRLRHLPNLLVRGGAEGTFVEHEWNALNLRVENVGFGPARRIALAFEGPFEVEGDAQIRGLGPNKEGSLQVFVRSHKEQYGPKVPLGLSLTYEDFKGGKYQLTERITVHVVQQGILPGLTTPTEIHIGNVYQAGAKKQEGGVVEMEIHRSAGGRMSVADSRVISPGSERQGNQVRRRCPACSLPIRDEKSRFCPECGARLAQNSTG